jgi:hypothetical protein
VWTHVAGTWDGTTLRAYMNSVEVATGTPGSALPSTSIDSYRIGSRHDSGGFSTFFPGSMEEVRIYDRALTPSEIASLYRDPFLEFVRLSTAA